MVTTTDLDERPKVEESLNLYAVVNTIPGPPDGVPEHANPQFLGYFGITLAQLKRWTTENVIHSDYLARERANGPSCLILDVSLPDLNGLDVQKRVVDRVEMPVIFITPKA
jgi:hypothetical protein